jgi:hypothetical protein
VVYVVGGTINSVASFATGERYNGETDTWSAIASMTTSRYGHALVALNGHLLAYGGCTGQRNLNSAERYDISRNLWEPMASMRLHRHHVCGCAFQVSSMSLNTRERTYTIHMSAKRDRLLILNYIEETLI